MSGLKFNFDGLNNIYVDALQTDRKTIVFEVPNGIGRFVFMMFFSNEDESKDQLFLYLARTNQLLSLKMYGRHKLHEPEKNEFSVYITQQHENQIRKELGIEGGGQNEFDLTRFLNTLNAGIPAVLPMERLQAACKQHTVAFGHAELKRVVDGAEKIYLIGPKNVPAGKKPREKTLRKLYWCVNANANDIELFITALKRVNKTLAWTKDKKFADSDIRQMINDL